MPIVEECKSRLEERKHTLTESQYTAATGGLCFISKTRLHPFIKAKSKHNYFGGGRSWSLICTKYSRVFLCSTSPPSKMHILLFCQAAPALHITHPAQSHLGKLSVTPSPCGIENAVTVKIQVPWPSCIVPLEARGPHSPFLIPSFYFRGLFVLPLTRISCCMFKLRKQKS